MLFSLVRLLLLTVLRQGLQREDKEKTLSPHQVVLGFRLTPLEFSLY